MNGVNEVVQYGAVGIALFLIVAFVIVLKLVFKIIGSHLHESSEAIKGMSGALQDLKKSQDNGNEVMAGVKELMRNCQRNQL